jgi:LmbE family N-acetylglucosaminyl deacetylase
MMGSDGCWSSGLLAIELPGAPSVVLCIMFQHFDGERAFVPNTCIIGSTIEGDMALLLRMTFGLLLISGIVTAQTTQELHEAFLDLSNDGVAMNVSAHPDDEDGSTLAYYRMKYGVKPYYVLFTRGEGGQNEKGPDLYEELGVLRSEETETAGKLLGTEVRFLNFMDFGYSKTATEAFRRWGGQMEVLRRLVYMIRQLKPDVIFTNHNTIDGHGHHQAAAITTIAAFDAAGDSTLFPEQLREPGITLWQPRKLFFRVFGRSEPTADVANAIEEVIPGRGVAALDVASEALRQHRTQGLERANLRAFTRGKSLYKLIRSNSLYDQDSTNFFGGIDFWRDHSITPLAGVRRHLSLIREGMSPDSLLLLSARILGGLDSIRSVVTLSPLAVRMVDHWRGDLDRLVHVTCGLTVKLLFDDPVVVARQRVGCSVQVNSDLCNLSGVQLQFDLPSGWVMNEEIGTAPESTDHRLTRRFTLQVGDRPVPTLPRAKAQYRPIETREEVAVRATLSLNGNTVSSRAAATFDVAPQQVLSLQPPTIRIALAHAARGATFEYTVRNFLPHKTAGRIRLEGPEGWRVEPSAFVIEREDSAATGRIVVRPPADIREGEYTLRFRTDFAFEEATVQVFDVAVTPGVEVGVIRSYDTTLENALRELGVTYKLLSDEDLATGDLRRWKTILVDIRAYLVREGLQKNNRRILDYAAGGGNVVVMYQREQEWKPEYAPFPFPLSRKRVTMEDAPVDMIAPDHLLLQKPNRITDKDWQGWKQERAVYFPVSVPGEYTQLLSTHDPDEPALTTGYLAATVGKGSYIYTSFVWYRELKEQNPGAYRCFANMISYPLLRK